MLRMDGAQPINTMPGSDDLGIVVESREAGCVLRDVRLLRFE